MSNKRKTNKRTILVDLIVLTLSQKKRKALKKVGNEKEPAKKKVKEAKEIHVNLWHYKDIQNADDLGRWTFPEPVRDLHDSSATLFELFLSTFVKRQAHTLLAQKGNHASKIDSNETKSFLAVLLLIGYIPYARRSMYWEMCLDR